jgi:spermidine/putrescine transport system substrate-binding protein
MTEGPIPILTRRVLLARGGQTALAASALASLLAACGDDDDGGGSGGESAAEGPTKAEIAAATGTVPALVWEGYDAKSIYEGLSGVTIKPGYLTQNEDVLTKLRVGDRAQYTLTTIFQGYIDPLLELDAIVPLDTSLLGNYSQLFPRFQNEEALRRDGTQYSIPFLWGTMQVNYNADETDRPATLDDLMDPSLKGRVGLNDDLYSSITQFARFAGAKNPNHLTQEELDETMELLRKFRPQVASIQPGSELTGLFARGEVAVATPDWAPSIVEARKAGLDVQSTMPALTFIDGWLLVNGAKDVAAAYKLVDKAISKQAQVTAGTELGLGLVNQAAAEALPKEIRAAWPYDDVDSLLDEAPAYPGVPIESDEFATLQDWVKAWEQFKAS